jgi:hypothetical protein
MWRKTFLWISEIDFKTGRLNQVPNSPTLKSNLSSFPDITTRPKIKLHLGSSEVEQVDKFY